MELQNSSKKTVLMLYYVLTKENQRSQPKEIIVCILLVFVLHSIIGNIIIMTSTSIDVIVVPFGIIIVTVEASFVGVVRYYKIQFPNNISKYVNNLQYNETAHTVWAALKKVT